MKRQQKNITECVMSENHTMLCFFADETMKKIELNTMEDVEDLKKVIK